MTSIKPILLIENISFISSVRILYPLTEILGVFDPKRHCADRPVNDIKAIRDKTAFESLLRCSDVTHRPVRAAPPQVKHTYRLSRNNEFNLKINKNTD